MTLTEIEDNTIERFLNCGYGVSEPNALVIAAYLNFLQAVEIRRRLTAQASRRTDYSGVDISFQKQPPYDSTP